MQQFTAHLHDESGTAALGAALARALVPGLAIHLHGDLGAGKTALTRAMLHAAGHQGNVKSPTYTLAEPYRIVLDGRAVDVIHFDLYRMAGAEEFLDAGFREDFNTDNICIVEWPEKAEPVPRYPNASRLKLEAAEDTVKQKRRLLTRQAAMVARAPHGAAAIRQVEARGEADAQTTHTEHPSHRPPSHPGTSQTPDQ